MEKAKKVLVVDDQPDYLQTINRILEDSDLPIILFNAPNGKIALDLVERITPDLVITDWEMPVMEGIELVKHIKRNEATCEIPVIMCTGIMTTSSNLKIALDAGASDYIRKPIDELELIARTRAALDLADSRQEILKNNLQLEELVKLKDKFFSIIAHDLRGPLGNLFNLGELLLLSHDDLQDERKKVILEAIVQDAKASYGLLDNLLNWARANSENLQPVPVKINIKFLVNEVLELLMNSANAKEIKLDSDISAEIQGFADYNMISTVLRNLVANAIKFTPIQGDVCIYAQLCDKVIKITVADTGVGMSADVLASVFNRSTMHSTPGTLREKGTGLGLILSKEFVQRNNGEITVESEVGVGTKMSFTLPILT